MNRKHILAYLPWILSALGSALLLYPVFSDALAGLRQSEQIEAYEARMYGMASLEEQKAAAAAYNRMIAREQKISPFSYRGSEATDEAYEKQLDGPDGQMCILEVPSADIRLPVLHGTTEEVLTACAGHMYGTSLPCGGRDSHCVLTGHTGLPTAMLFTNLNKVQEGDEILITVLGEEHRYIVSEIRVVLPEDEAGYLQIRPGEDLLTLYTCTPYGINDHRLLVCAKRASADQEPGEGAAGPETPENRTRAGKQMLQAALSAGIPVLILVFGLITVFRDNAETQRKTKE